MGVFRCLLIVILVFFFKIFDYLGGLIFVGIIFGEGIFRLLEECSCMQNQLTVKLVHHCCRLRVNVKKKHLDIVKCPNHCFFGSGGQQK